MFFRPFALFARRKVSMFQNGNALKKRICGSYTLLRCTHDRALFVVISGQTQSAFSVPLFSGYLLFFSTLYRPRKFLDGSVITRRGKKRHGLLFSLVYMCFFWFSFIKSNPQNRALVPQGPLVLDCMPTALTLVFRGVRRLVPSPGLFGPV